MKKLLSTSMAIAVALSCLADDVPALKISKSDGESAVALPELQSIKYTETDMVVNMKDGTQQVIALDDIIVIDLEQDPTVISNIFADCGNDAVYTITDLTGKLIAKGDAAVLAQRSLFQKGIYIITVGDKSKKILIK